MFWHLRESTTLLRKIHSFIHSPKFDVVSKYLLRICRNFVRMEILGLVVVVEKG
jgi:hypothetical protein